MVPAVTTLLAENRRTSTKGAIRRGSAKARSAMRRMDAQLQREVDRMYRQAASDIKSILAQHADSAGNLRLEVLRGMLSAIEQRISSLGEERDARLGSALQEAARLGVQPFAAAGSTFPTRAADAALAFVTSFVAEDGLQLSDRLWRLDDGAIEAVGAAVKRAVIEGHSASQAVNEFLVRGEKPPSDLVKKTGAASVERVAREADGALLYIDGNPRAGALQVFRTEINRAHGEAYMLGAEDSPDFAGFRFLLSPRHPRVDICDMYASVNRYGLGPGVYPSREKCPWPAHPNTLSFVEIVFSDEISEEDRAGRQTRIEWLKAQPPGVQVSVLNSRKKRTALQMGILREGEIATPWRVLKKRYERRGLSTDDWGRSNTQWTEPADEKPSGKAGKPPRFKPARTSREAAKWAVDNGLADAADYSGAHVDVANAWNRSVAEHLEAFPELRAGLQFIGTVQARNRVYRQYRIEQYMERLRRWKPDASDDELLKIARKNVKVSRTPGNVWAYSTDTKPISGVSVNAKWARDPQKLAQALKRNVESRYHPVGTDSVKAIIDHELGHELDRLLGISRRDDVIGMYYDWVRVDPTGSQLSRYAAENVLEFVAEAWSEYRNNPNPRRLAMKIGRIIETAYQEKFE